MIRSQEQDIVQICLEKLSELHGTSVRLNGSKAAGGGCINYALKISTSAGNYFLKWNASAPPDMFRKEAAGLAEMRSVDNPYLIIPKVIWCTETDDLPGILLMEYLESAIPTKGFDEKLGRGIAQLHRKTASAFGFHHPNYCGSTVQENTWTASWPEFFAERRVWALVQKLKIKRLLSSTELHTYEKLVDKIPALLSHLTVPSLIHGDLWSGNYMHTLLGPALIDPACNYADREMELGMMKLFGGFSREVFDAYLEEFPLPEGWQERNRLYQLYHVLNHYLLFGVSYKQHALEIAEAYL
jgi:protein-ribulosamine 3-kinase